MFQIEEINDDIAFQTVNNYYQVELEIQDSSTSINLTTSNYNSLIYNTDSIQCLLFFTYWCPNSIKYLSEIYALLKENGIQILFITPESSRNSSTYEDYFKKLKINENIYYLDKSWSKGSIHRKMKSLIHRISDDGEELGGFPSVIIIKKKRVLYKQFIDEKSYPSFKKFLLEIKGNR